MAKNYYEKFGIAQCATQQEIESAYQELAMKYYQNRNKGDSKSEIIFKELNEIYHTLSNPVRRNEYDLSVSSEQEDSESITFYQDDNGNLTTKKSIGLGGLLVGFVVTLFYVAFKSFLFHSAVSLISPKEAEPSVPVFFNEQYNTFTPSQDSTALLNFLKNNSISVK